MKILLTGSSGLVGSALRKQLTQEGHTVVPLVRHPAGDGEIFWNPDAGTLDAKQLTDIEAVIHLAGESVAGKRWTDLQKERILSSRVRGTELLAKTIAELPIPPHVLLSASATGYYGDTGDNLVTEESPAGEGFLADVCQEWEQSTFAASSAGIRVVRVRIGIVLAENGGALEKMLPPFRMGLGGVIGSGHQWMSWITLADLCGIFRYLLEDDSIYGPVNAVSPYSVTNAAFTQALGKALGRPAVVPVPAFALRLLLGEMADERLLASSRIEPAVLNQAGYTFLHPDIDSALRTLPGL